MTKPDNKATLFLDRLHRITCNAKKGAIFEFAAERFLMHHGFPSVIRWPQWDGREVDINGIDIVARDTEGRLHGVQAKCRKHSIASSEIISFVSSMTEYHASSRDLDQALEGAIFITSKATLDPRHRKTMQILLHQKIPLRIFVHEDLVADDAWIDDDLLALVGYRGQRKKEDRSQPQAVYRSC